MKRKQREKRFAVLKSPAMVNAIARVRVRGDARFPLRSLVLPMTKKATKSTTNPNNVAEQIFVQEFVTAVLRGTRRGKRWSVCAR